EGDRDARGVPGPLPEERTETRCGVLPRARLPRGAQARAVGGALRSVPEHEAEGRPDAVCLLRAREGADVARALPGGGRVGGTGAAALARARARRSRAPPARRGALPAARLAAGARGLPGHRRAGAERRRSAALSAARGGLPRGEP